MVFSLFRKKLSTGESYFITLNKVKKHFGEHSVLLFSAKSTIADIKARKTIDISGKSENSIDPSDLEQIFYESQNFISLNDDSLIIIDGFDLLVEANGFDKVFHFILNLKDFTSSKSANLLIIYDKKSIDKENLKKIKNQFKLI